MQTAVNPDALPSFASARACSSVSPSASDNLRAMSR
jgi:hypothetical protein